MKICLINNRYYPYNRGGAEAVVLEMKKKLEKQGHQVYIITTKPKGSNGQKELHDVYYLPSQYYKLSSWSFLRRLGWHFKNMFGHQQSNKVIKIIKDNKIDLVITHNIMGLGFQVPRKLAKEKILHHHFLHDVQLLHPSGLMFYKQEKKLNSIPSRIYQSINKYLFSQASKIISPSQWLLTEHTKRGFFINAQKKIERLDFNCPEVNNVHKDNYLLFVGQIEKHKGLDILIRAFSNKAFSTNLFIIGQGSKLGAMKKLAETNKNIKFLDWKDKEELNSLIKNSRGLIVPSICYENSPTIIPQAHCFNIPIIASNIGGIPETINKQDLLFEPQNIIDLQEKIQQLLDNTKS